MSEERVLAIIPARGGSKRFPRKNLAFLAGKPLLAHAIAAAKESRVFTTVLVSSEDEEILEAARRWGADQARRRPESLATDTASVKEVCLHTLKELEAEGDFYPVFGILLTTNPLRSGEDVRRAYETFLASGKDALMSLVPYAHPPQRAVHLDDEGRVRPYWGHQYMTQTQRLEPLYRHDGSIFLARTRAFYRQPELYADEVAAFFQPVERSVDIDSPLDLQWAQFLLDQKS